MALRELDGVKEFSGGIAGLIRVYTDPLLVKGGGHLGGLDHVCERVPERDAKGDAALV